VAEFEISVDISDVLKMFEDVGGDAVQRDINRITETYARKMAAEAADNAPVKTGALKNSLASSPRPSQDEDGVWEWGSDLPYATRQEFEHATKKAFVRKAIWNNEEQYREAVRTRLTKG